MKTFKSYLESQGKSKSTIKSYNSYLMDFMSFMDRDRTTTEDATEKEVLAYLSYLKNRELENETRSIRLGVLNHFFEFQIYHNQRADNPAKHLRIRGTKRKKLYPILNQQELEKLYLAYEVPTEADQRANRNWFKTYKLSRQRNKVILSLLVNQGLTTAEITRIEVQDLKLRQGELDIVRSRTSNQRTLKLKSNQVLDLMEYTLQIRQELLEYQTNKTTSCLFLSTSTTEKETKGISLEIFKTLTKELKKHHPKFINFQQVRTSVITRWLKQYNLREVQQKAGHRFISSTEAYQVNDIEDLQEDINKYHPF